MSLETGISALANAVGTSIKSLNTNKISTSEKGAANGVATLDGTGKLPTSQMPAYTVGGLVYQGVWNANTNTPAMPSAGVANKGYYYKVSIAGSTTIDTINDWKIGDWIVSNGSTWDKVDNTESVTSVAGRTGAIVLTNTDVGLGNVSNLAPADLGISSAAQSALDLKADKVAGKGLSTEDYTTAEKTKLSGITAGAQPNEFTFKTIAVSGQSSVVADTTTDTLTLVAGTNIAITTDASTDTITISGTSTGVTNISTTHNIGTVIINSDTGTDGTINGATQTTAGVMSSADKTKLDGIATGAQVNAINTVSGRTGDVTLTKADVGLSLVDNTSDLSKPISTATQSALDLKASASALSTLTNNVGATDINFVSVFNAALV